MVEDKLKEEVVDTAPKANIEEKRIKPAVIRRRAAKKPPEEKVVEPEQIPKEDAKAEPAVADKPAPSKTEEVAAKAPAKKEAKAESAPSTVAAKKKTFTKKSAKKMAPAVVKPSEEPAKKDAPATIKREVKIFEKKKPFERPSPVRPVFARRGKGKRFQQRDRFRRPQQTQFSRALNKTEITKPGASKMVVKVSETITVSEFSQKLGVRAGEIIKKLMALEIMVSVNEFIDFETAALIAEEYGYGVEDVAVKEEHLIESTAKGVAEKGDMVSRAPIVTVMGHVDHGKTSLLDVIRKARVASGEAGGITQHIGAYRVELKKGDITFLDTPGHEAFTAMRSRGAGATDIVILVVAADDGVMPQTVEAINHAKAAGVPIIVAINKVDLPDADPKKIMQALTEYELVSEEWGGDTIMVEVSAKAKTNIDTLLDMIVLQADMLELKADPKAQASGVIVEAKLDKGRGAVSTVLIQNGTLKVGDDCVAGEFSGRVKAMLDDCGNRIKEAGPSTPVEILGLSGVPLAGDSFSMVKDEATARQIVELRSRKASMDNKGKNVKVSLEDLFEHLSKGDVKELNIVIKGDVQGSIEALKDSLMKLSTDKVGVNIIHSAAGGINESDVMLASTSGAIIIGFNVRSEPKAAKLAEREAVDIRLYRVIYDVTDDIKKAMEGLLEPIIREETLGRAEVREVFKVSKVGTIAGSYVVDGKITRSAKLRLVRDNVVIYEGDVSSLKRFKDDAKEVATGYECGIGIAGYNDLKEGDVIEAFLLKEEAATL